LTSLLGPVTAGFCDRFHRHRATYLLLALFPALPILTLLFLRGCCPNIRFIANRSPSIV